MRKILGCLAVLLCIGSTANATTFGGGAGAGGYSGHTGAYNFRDISNTGTVVLANTDDSATGPGIGLGFNFSFFGNTFSTANIATNGFLSFDNASGLCCSGTQMGVGQGVSNQIAAFHMDWMTYQPGANIYYQTVGSAASREFIVQWNNVNEFFNNNRATFEAVLHEGSNEIELQYASASSFGHSATVGIQNGSRNAGLALFQNATGQNLTQTGVYVSAVPEPESLAMFGVGLLAIALKRRRARK